MSLLLSRLFRWIWMPLMLLKDRPVLYRGRSFTLVGYGVFAALNALAVVSLTSLFLYSKGQEVSSALLVVFPVMAAGTWAGSRVLHLVALGRKLLHKPGKYVFETGFYVQGGILGAMASSALAAPYAGVNMLLLWDGLAWSALLGLFFGRLGCFNYGCCFGKPTTHPHGGVRYYHPEVKILRLRPELAGRSVHPTQLYTAALHLVTFTLTTVLLRHWSLPSGVLAAAFFIYHGASRLLIERYRADIHFHEGRNRTTFVAAAAMAGLGLALLALGPTLLPGFGQIVDTVRPPGPAAMFALLAQRPALLLSLAAVAALVLGGFGIHGTRLGSFPRPEFRSAASRSVSPLDSQVTS